MFLTERLPLLDRDEKVSSIPLALVQGRVSRACVVSILNEENLETPLSEGQFLDSRYHVLLPIELADDGVELELDLEFSAPVANSEQLLDIFARSTADELVGLLVEAITGHSHDIEELAILVQPSLGNFGAVRDDGNALQPKDSLAVLTKEPEFLRIEERLTTSKVDLAHACFLQEPQAALHLLFSRHMRRLFGVEAEFASLVAFAGEMIIHGNAVNGLRGWTQMVDLEVYSEGKSD